MIRRPKTLLALIVTGTIALAGCSSAAPVATAAKAAGKDVLALLKSDALGSLKLVASKGATTNSVAFTMSGTSMGKSMSGHGVMGFRPMRAEMQVSAGGQDVTVRLLGTVMYLKVPGAQSGQLGGKQWMKFDLAKSAALSGMNVDELTNQMKNNDPGHRVQELIDAGALKVVGEEDIDGKKTVHYAGTEDLTKYISKNGAKSAALRRTFAAMKINAIGLNVWVDENYQVRRASTDMGSLGTVTVSYTSYGLPVDVIAPPPSQTVDLLEMMATLKSHR